MRNWNFPVLTRIRGRSPLGDREIDLDVLRGVAILLAMGWHLNGHPTGVVLVDALRWPGVKFGWVGVDLFFVLSGFLIGRIILRQLHATGGFDRKRFLVRRIFKLWPVLYVFLVAQLVLGDNPWQTYFLQTFFQLQNYLHASHEHLWSLAVEEHFYLAVAVLLPLAARRGWQASRYMVVLVAVLVIALLARVVGQLAGVAAGSIQTLSHFRVDALAMGLILAVVFVYYPNLYERLLRLRWLWILIVGWTVTFLILVPGSTALANTVGFTVTYLGGAAALLAVHRAPALQRIAPLLRPIAFLGILSYGLYIWHIAAGNLAEIALRWIDPMADAAAVLVAKYVVAIVVAYIVTRVIEWPSLALRNRLFPQMTGPSPVKAISITKMEPRDEGRNSTTADPLDR